MIYRLQFGDILQVKGGKKEGRWYCKAKIPVEYRDAYKDSQATAWLGSGSLADAQALLPKVKEKEQQKFLAKVAKHDPLLVAAERLYDALFSKSDDITGRNLPVSQWHPAPITKDELANLKRFTRDPSTERTEFNRIVQTLRNEVFKVLHAEYDASLAIKVSDNSFSAAKGIMLDMDASAVSKEKALDTLDAVATNADIGLEFAAPRYANWRPLGWLAQFKSQLLSEGNTDLQVQRKIELLYALGGSSSTFDAINKRDHINDAYKEFVDQHDQKLGTKIVTGKSYSDAMSEWALRQENPELGVKRLKTRGEYINSQKMFLKVFGDLDVSEITKAHGTQFIEYLESERKAANGTITKHLSGVRAPLARAVQLNWIADDPLFGLKVAKRGTAKKKTETWNVADIHRLLQQSLPKDIRMLFQILICTGFRLEEGAALEWKDVKVSVSGVRYFDLFDVNKKLKTEHAQRHVPIHHQLYPFLTAYGAEEGKQGQLFNFKRDKDGKCVKAATKALDPYIKAARFDNGVFVKHLKTHGLRGTFTTACYSAGVNDSMRRFLGGWRQLGDDKTYLHPDLDAENEMLQKINFDHICCA